MPPHYYKQLVASLIDLSTTEVAYLGTLIDKWLSWAPLWSKRCFSDEHLRRPPSGDTCLRGWRVPPVAFTFKYVVLLLLLLLSGDIELNPGPSKPFILPCREKVLQTQRTTLVLSCTVETG